MKVYLSVYVYACMFGIYMHKQTGFPCLLVHLGIIPFNGMSLYTPILYSTEHNGYQKKLVHTLRLHICNL